MNLSPKTENILFHLFERIDSWISPIDAQLPPFYLVGGAVRDCLLERSSRDVDLVSPAAELLAGLIAEANSARAVRFEKCRGEVNFRIAVSSDPEDILDISQMHGKDIKEDLGARDFTINAMAVVCHKNSSITIIDPLDGQSDISGKIIRQTSADSLRRDPMRILRAFRLAAELGFQIDAGTLHCIQEQKTQLPAAAPERIREELIRTFSAKNSAPCIHLMGESGVLEEIVPEIRQMKGCSQNAYHHLDVWGHSLLVFDTCEYIINHLSDFFGDKATAILDILDKSNRLPLLKLSALLHDIGKPGSREIRSADGRVTFYGHEKTGAGLISEIARGLRFSGKECNYLKFLVAEHLHILSLLQPEVKKSTLTRFIRKAKDDFIPLLILAIADMKGKRGDDNHETQKRQYIRRTLQIAEMFFNEINPQLDRKLLISGKDILELGVKPGPEVGTILNSVQEAQDGGLVTDKSSALVFAEKLIKQYRKPDHEK